MRNQLFEVKAVNTFIHLSLHIAWHLPNFSQFCFKVPFIAFYRKEYVEPELNINDLWKVWQWDEKVWRLLLSTFRKTHCSHDKHIPFAFLILHLPVDSAEDQEAKPDPAVSKDAVLPVWADLCWPGQTVSWWHPPSGHCRYGEVCLGTPED